MPSQVCLLLGLLLVGQVLAQDSEETAVEAGSIESLTEEKCGMKVSN